MDNGKLKVENWYAVQECDATMMNKEKMTKTKL